MIPRLTLAVAAVAMFALTAPAPLSVRGALALAGLVVTSYAVRYPGSVAVSGVLALAVLCWLAGVQDPGLFRAVAFGAAGFVVHSSAALAAAVTPRAPVATEALLAWAVRGGLAVLAGAGLVALTATAGSLPNSGAMVVLGLTAGVVLVGLLVLPLQRRGGRSAGSAPRT